MGEKIKKWYEKNFHYLLVIFLVIVGWIIIFLIFTSMASGQTTEEVEVKNGQLIVYETVKTKKEIIPLPSAELGVSDENAKKVCLTKEKKITVMEEIDKKINFFSFPFVKTKTIWQKEIWYDKYDGWQSLTLCPKKISENFWALTSAMIVLFFSFLFLSWSAWRNKKIGGLFKSYFFIILSCLFFAIHTGCLTIWAIAITLALSTIGGISAWVASVNIILQKDYGASADVVIGGSTAILIIFNIILAIVTADYNSALEFMSTLLLIMAITCFIGWLLSLGKVDIKSAETNADTNCSLK